MLSRRGFLGTVLLTLAFAHQVAGSAAAETITRPEIQIQVSPACIQPGGLLHVTITPSSPEFRQKMIRSPEYRAAFFDVFTEWGITRSAFFDVFTELSVARQGFFDIFVEWDVAPGTAPERSRCMCVCGYRTRTSIELLIQLPAGKVVKGKGPRGGGLILHESSGRMIASTPVLGTDPKSPIELGEASGWGISSFFDVFTELSLAPGEPNPSPRIPLVLLHQGRLICDAAEAAAGHAIRGLDAPEAEKRVALDVLDHLCDDLDRLWIFDLTRRP
jgi:hypothetical protein